MMQIFKQTTKAIAASFLLSTGLIAQERGEIGIALGETPQLVEVEDLDGNMVSLASFAGEKPVLFEFWAYWCENCAELHPHLVEAYRKYSDRIEFVAVGVGVAQSPRRMRRHLADLEPPPPWSTLFDKGGKAVRAFLAPATSYIAIIDPSGKVVYTGIGPDQDIDAVVRGILEETQ